MPHFLESHEKMDALADIKNYPTLVDQVKESINHCTDPDWTKMLDKTNCLPPGTVIQRELCVCHFNCGEKSYLLRVDSTLQSYRHSVS